MSKFMTVTELCEVLDLSRPTVMRHLESGELPGSKIGNRWRISKAVLAERLGVDVADLETTITSRYPESEDDDPEDGITRRYSPNTPDLVA